MQSQAKKMITCSKPGTSTQEGLGNASLTGYEDINLFNCMGLTCMTASTAIACRNQLRRRITDNCVSEDDGYHCRKLKLMYTLYN